MFTEANFVVRVSGKRENSYYIDYLGEYKLEEVAKIVGLPQREVKDIFISKGAVFDETTDVYYFNSLDNAKSVISNIVGKMKRDYKGKVVFLTETEIEYILKALINDGGNTIHVNNKIKDTIFKKLNQ